jgi:hypothetical protein
MTDKDEKPLTSDEKARRANEESQRKGRQQVAPKNEPWRPFIGPDCPIPHNPRGGNWWGPI